MNFARGCPLELSKFEPSKAHIRNPTHITLNSQFPTASSGGHPQAVDPVACPALPRPIVPRRAHTVTRAVACAWRPPPLPPVPGTSTPRRPPRHRHFHPVTRHASHRDATGPLLTCVVPHCHRSSSPVTRRHPTPRRPELQALPPIPSATVGTYCNSSPISHPLPRLVLPEL
jgi:hypothetical protein